MSETKNTIHRAKIVEIIPANWGRGRAAVLDAPSPDFPGPLTVTIPKGSRGWKVGAEIAYTLEPATMQTVDAYGRVLSEAPLPGRTTVNVLMHGKEPAS